MIGVFRVVLVFYPDYLCVVVILITLCKNMATFQNTMQFKKKHKKALEMKLRCFVKGGKEGCDLE